MHARRPRELHVDPADAAELTDERTPAYRCVAASALAGARASTGRWALPVAGVRCCAPDGPLDGRDARPPDRAPASSAGPARAARAGRLRPERAGRATGTSPTTWDHARRLHAVLAGSPRRSSWRPRSRPATSCRSDDAGGRDHRRALVDGRRPRSRTGDPGDRRRYVAGRAPPTRSRRATSTSPSRPAPARRASVPALHSGRPPLERPRRRHVVHDEQSVLTKSRVAAIADGSPVPDPGRRMAGFIRVGSRTTPGSRSPDLVAEVVRDGALEHQLRQAGTRRPCRSASTSGRGRAGRASPARRHRPSRQTPLPTSFSGTSAYGSTARAEVTGTARSPRSAGRSCRGTSAGIPGAGPAR